MTALIRRTVSLALLAAGGAISAQAAAAAPLARTAPTMNGVPMRSFDLTRAVVSRTAIDAPADASALVARASRAAAPADRAQGIGLPYAPSLSTAGDLNSAGYSEQLVGLPIVPTGGTVKLLYRAPGGTTIQTLPKPSAATESSFGNSVTSADVNGDGFPDAIVGDPLNNAGGSGAGAIYVYHGTAAGASSLPSTTRMNGGAFANFGYSVAYAGDVNGDGYDDVIVGAPGWRDDQTDEGAAYLYLGGPAGLAANPAWHVEGAINFGWMGYDVSTAGDVNGDGYDDVLVGEPFYSGGEGSEGRVNLYLGSPTGIQPGGEVHWESNITGARLGWSVSTAGDANADGYCEWAAGAPYYSNGESSEGAVYLFQGASSPFIAPPPLIGEGGTATHLYGYDLAPGGDFNGDGLADLIAGRPGYSNLAGNVGGYDVLLGLADLSSWPFPGNFQGTVVNGGFGARVAIGGDVDGDGFSDPLTLEFGGVMAPEGVLEPTLVELHGFSLAELGFGFRDRVAAGPYYSHTGWSLATGDVNGDGYDDLVTGGPFGFGGSFAGVLQMFLGHTGGLGTPPALPILFPPNDWSYQGAQDGAILGLDVACGDVNGDGYDDIIAGAPHFANGQPNEGAVYAFYGSPGGPSSSPDWIVEGNLTNGEFGSSVAIAGDVNGDGYADVLVGAPFQSLGEAEEGAAYLYYGSPLGLANAPARTYQPNVAGSLFGYDVAGLGDVDGDGWDDFGIGNPDYANGQAVEGAVFVYRGLPAGPSAVFDVVESNVAGLGLGQKFCGAGDTNGDGKADLLCGMQHATVGFSNEGELRLYYGSAGGFPTNPDWTLDGGDVNVRIGADVSTAGDANGDGLSDFIAGLPGQYTGDGAAWVFLGGTTLPTLFPVQELYEGGGGGTGLSVAGGADFNGDGFGDVAAGAPFVTVGKGIEEGVVQYALSGVLQANQLVHRPIDTYRPLSDTPVGSGLRSDATNSYRLRGRMRLVGGRGRVRTDAESKPFGTPFNGLGVVHTPWLKTASPTAGNPNTLPVTINFTGLAANTKHHWRARYAPRSPLYNPSHWMSPQANGMTQGDVRTAGNEFVVDVPPGSHGTATLALSSARPNPATALAPTTFAFALPRDGRVTLSLHDATGRRVRALLDRAAPAGSGAAAWDLKDDAGVRVAAGVYFARLSFEGESRESKVVVLP